jgi:transposase
MQPIDDASANPMNSRTDQPWPFPFGKADWDHTPVAVRVDILALQSILAEQQKATAILQKRVEELEARLNHNPSNPKQAPSADSPFLQKRHKPHPGRPGGKKDHKGHRQVMLEPNDAKSLKPELCPCGNREFPETVHYDTHQFIELPEIKMEVTYFLR